MYLDSCDFSRSTATVLVSVGDATSSTAVVRNAVLSTGNYEAIS